MSSLSDAASPSIAYTPVAVQSGDRVIINSQAALVGTVRYVGATHFKLGTWVGIELDAPVGKNDGSVEGVRYFQCQSGRGVFVRPDVVQSAPSVPKSAASGSFPSLFSQLTPPMPSQGTGTAAPLLTEYTLKSARAMSGVGQTPLSVSMPGRAVLTQASPPHSPESTDNSQCDASVATASTMARTVSRAATPTSTRSAPAVRKLATTRPTNPSLASVSSGRKPAPAPLQTPGSVASSVAARIARARPLPVKTAAATVMGNQHKRVARPSTASAPAVSDSASVGPTTTRGRVTTRPVGSIQASSEQQRPRSASRGRSSTLKSGAVTRQASSRGPTGRSRSAVTAMNRMDSIVSPSKPAAVPTVNTDVIAKAAALRPGGMSQPRQPSSPVLRARTQTSPRSSGNTINGVAKPPSPLRSPLAPGVGVSVSPDVDALLAAPVKQVAGTSSSLLDTLMNKHKLREELTKPPVDRSLPNYFTDIVRAPTATVAVVTDVPSVSQKPPTPRLNPIAEFESKSDPPSPQSPVLAAKEEAVLQRTETALTQLITAVLSNSPDITATPTSASDEPSLLALAASGPDASLASPATSVPPVTPAATPSVLPPVVKPASPRPAPPPVPPAVAASLLTTPISALMPPPKPNLSAVTPARTLTAAQAPPPPSSGSVRVDTVPINAPVPPASPQKQSNAAGATPVTRETRPLSPEEPMPSPAPAQATPSQLFANIAVVENAVTTQSTEVLENKGLPSAQQDSISVPPAVDANEEVAVYSVATFAGMSQQGFGHDIPDKPNQDAIVMAEDPETGALLMAVFDGHGPFGHLVSDRLRVMIPPCLFGQSNFPSNIPRALQAAINEVEAIILQDSEVDCTLSGSTAVMCVSYQDKLVVGNVGDSRAVLFKRKNTEFGIGLHPHPLSRDHKPNLPSETKRILLAGGNIASITYDDGIDGPPRVWLRDEGVPGLAMSRSVGDTIAKQAGVCSEVEVTETILTEDDVCVIVGSDGLYEFVNNQHIADAVAAVAAETEGDESEWMKRSLQRLIVIATEAWVNAEGVTDDTSIILGLVGQTVL